MWLLLQTVYLLTISDIPIRLRYKNPTGNRQMFKPDSIFDDRNPKHDSHFWYCNNLSSSHYDEFRIRMFALAQICETEKSKSLPESLVATKVDVLTRPMCFKGKKWLNT